MAQESIFQAKKANTSKTVNIKIPAELHAELETIKKELVNISPDLTFNLSAICTKALTQAVRKATQELDSLKHQR